MSLGPLTPSSGASSGADIRFSRHAQDRLGDEGTALSASDRQRLGNGVQKAASKGAQEALMLLDDRAFIVNVPQKTVITSISQARLKENVFTNIDSAVII
jgi:flagellar operon protein